MAPQFPPDKKEAIEALLSEPVLARLGSVNPSGQPHVVPVWFLWDGTALWISAFSSTRKFKDLQSNPKAAVLIEPLKTDHLQAVLFEGPVELIQEPCQEVRDVSMRIYVRYMGEEGAHAAEPTSWSVDPENRLVKLIPSHIYAW